MKAFVIGSGGREHAIAWRLAQSPSVAKVYATPGNPGIAQVAECIPFRGSYLEIAAAIGADLTVVGPESPLVDGVVDEFRAAGRLIVGPTAAAARLEGSKIFAKNFMREAGIPTARYVATDDPATARKALAEFTYPVVLKADGLAAGKGVLIVPTEAEAVAGIEGLFSGSLVGDAGRKIVIEEFLQGEEVSFIALCDGKNALPLEPTQDHKAVHDGDTGPNTGGMGAYCDNRILTPEQTGDVLRTVIYPTLERTGFTGFLYAGLMLTSSGIKVLEFNVRLGDPETQALMHRISGDCALALEAAARGSLAGVKLSWKQDPSVCVVLAASGYPGKVRTGDPIHGLAEASAHGAAVFQAGTRMGSTGIETSGGRVLGVTASGSTLQAAIDEAYRAVARIRFDGMHFRRDIGRKGLKRW